MSPRVLAISALVAGALAGSCSRAEPPGVLAGEVTRDTTGRTAGASTSSSPVVSAGVAAPPALTDSRARLPAEERTWTFTSPELGTVPVVVLVPERAPDERFPVLVTMHGRGEALKGPTRGVRGWVDDYHLGKAIERLASPPLTARDFSSFVKPERLARLNQALREQPYRGLVIACPYTPDALRGEEFLKRAEPLARVLVDELLPRLYRETPALGTSASTAVDGVSLGGRAAYSVGLLRPEAFGVVAGLQAAFDVEEVPRLLSHARAASKRNPRLSFRMLTSDGDYFREPDAAIARAFTNAGLPMRFDEVVGPHDYAFNRGPGAIEMLVFHDRALRGEPPP